MINKKIYKSELEKLKEELYISKNKTLTNTKINNFDGVFEVHITVDPQNEFVGLLNYVKNHQVSKGMKVVFAASFIKNNQYILSYFTRKDNDKLVVDEANKIAQELEKAKIKVMRVKVEGHGVKGTPITTLDYDLVCKYIDEKYQGTGTYFYIILYKII